MLQNKKNHLVLASSSPRRKELLSYIGVPFSVNPSLVDESCDEKDPKRHAEILAERKGRDVLSRLDPSNYPGPPLVVSSDTVVSLKGKIFGKPKDQKEARIFLTELSGKTHHVYTGVYLANLEKELTFISQTKVTFDDISSELMNLYIETGDSLDKAGAYGIQGMAMSFTKNIEGSYSNVVGFPVCDFVNYINKFFNDELWWSKFI